MTIIIVLANLMSSNGELNDESKDRVELAAEVDRELSSQMILLCGWDYRPDSNLAVADAMHKFMTDQYPDLDRKIKCQRLSRDTVGDAIFARLYLESSGYTDLSSINVITSDYHVHRTNEIFKFVFGNVPIVMYGAPTLNKALQTEKHERKSLASFQSTFSDVKSSDISAILVALSEKHPYYNGEVFPRLDYGSASFYFSYDAKLK